MKMRKKMVLVCVSLLLLVNCGAIAMVHAYLYGLHADANYIGKNISDGQIDTLNTQVINKGAPSMVYMGKVGKLSNPETEIMMRALGQYDITPGEVYYIFIMNENTATALVFYVRVDSISGNGTYDGYMSDIARWRISR